MQEGGDSTTRGIYKIGSLPAIIWFPPGQPPALWNFGGILVEFSGILVEFGGRISGAKTWFLVEFSGIWWNFGGILVEHCRADDSALDTMEFPESQVHFYTCFRLP